MFRKRPSTTSTKLWWDFRYIWMFISTIWVFTMVGGVISTWQTTWMMISTPIPNDSPEFVHRSGWSQVVATFLALAFIGIYVEAMYRMYFGRSTWIADVSTRERWLIRGSLLVVALSLAWLPDENTFRVWPYTFVFVVIAWTLTAAPNSAFSAVVISTTLVSAIIWYRYDEGVMLNMAVMSLGLGFFTAGYVINRGVINELRLERSRVRDQAITEERFRLARDLHDTVGHSMTQITLKAQLARKLLTTEPIRATAELTDIEQLSRALSTEIRHSIAGDVAPTLAIELDRAAELLSAAGVQLYRQIDASGLSEDLDALFGWVVREGTLNVIKHSAASCCEITLTRESDGFSLTVLDNGASSSTEVAPGQGLTGLRQRAEAIGGSVHWQQTDSGFTLEVRIPAA